MMRRAALLGNPNVGKSTIFNALTGMHQHTGNWSGVTVSCTWGTCKLDHCEYSIVDLPGIYSFDTRSEEETVTKQFVESQNYDVLILICDATCLERGLHLLRQTIACTAFPRLLLCVNLCDEAAKKGISIDFERLEQELHIPVVPCCAREPAGLERLKTMLSTPDHDLPPLHPLELPNIHGSETSSVDIPADFLPSEVAAKTVRCTSPHPRKKEERLDRILTGRITGTLCMLLLLTGVFWLTIAGANYPSAVLWDLFFHFETTLIDLANNLHIPEWFTGIAVHGVYRVVAWIVSVMLPPMAIFFPLFTLLEDFGLLPRIAFNMDGMFHRCGTCGKQCLTMTMGLGCNAAGVTGCRIIDSPRERLIAILTNSLVPCNGRFPLLITMISLGMLSFGLNLTHPAASFLPALTLTCFLLLSILASLVASHMLSRTVLQGIPSSFTLELPPYRRPAFRKVIIRSIFDRTFFVLGRAIAVAAPAGLLIWIMANIFVDGRSLLETCSYLLDPFGRILGLDGVILMAFLLGFPANEIVLPIILMAYTQNGQLVEMEEISTLFSLLSANGWTLKTYLCMAIFSLFHWPCSTTCLTIRKETGSWRWTAAAFLLPTLIGTGLCMIICRILSYH